MGLALLFRKGEKAKFDLDENQIRPYLPLNQVREGAFYVANKLYGITFTELKDIPLPHPDALAFECKDKDGTHLGVLYMDFFPRASKRGGAWCGTYRSQTYVDGKRQGPVVTIVCNFTQPAAGQPALLSADEASTLSMNLDMDCIIYLKTFIIMVYQACPATLWNYLLR